MSNEIKNAMTLLKDSRVYFEGELSNTIDLDTVDISEETIDLLLKTQNIGIGTVYNKDGVKKRYVMLDAEHLAELFNSSPTYLEQKYGVH